MPSHLSSFPRRQEQFQRNPDSYNGAVRENYTWSQDYTDLELKVPVPKHVVKGRQVTAGPLQLLTQLFSVAADVRCGLCQSPLAWPAVSAVLQPCCAAWVHLLLGVELQCRPVVYCVVSPQKA